MITVKIINESNSTYFDNEVGSDIYLIDGKEYIGKNMSRKDEERFASDVYGVVKDLEDEEEVKEINIDDGSVYVYLNDKSKEKYVVNILKNMLNFIDGVSSESGLRGICKIGNKMYDILIDCLFLKLYGFIRIHCFSHGLIVPFNRDSYSKKRNRNNIKYAIKYLSKSPNAINILNSLMKDFAEDDKEFYSKVYNVLKNGCVYLSSDDEEGVIGEDNAHYALDIIYNALFGGEPNYSGEHEVDIINTKFGKVVVYDLKHIEVGAPGGYDYIFIPDSVVSKLVDYLNDSLSKN